MRSTGDSGRTVGSRQRGGVCRSWVPIWRTASGSGRRGEAHGGEKGAGWWDEQMSSAWRADYRPRRSPVSGHGCCRRPRAARERALRSASAGRLNVRQARWSMSTLHVFARFFRYAEPDGERLAARALFLAPNGRRFSGMTPVRGLRVWSGPEFRAVRSGPHRLTDVLAVVVGGSLRYFVLHSRLVLKVRRRCRAGHRGTLPRPRSGGAARGSG